MTHQERPGPGPQVDRRTLWRAFAASLSGTALEWYDFAVYSAASALVLGQLFFPSEDPLAGTLAAFSTYAVGYVARPLGGFVFGRLGDRVGRKKVLVSTLVLIGVATFLIGLLPTHADIGPTAAVLLVALRFAQGVGVGGEWGGAVLLSSEFGDPRRRGFFASAAQVGPPAGNLMANGVLALLGAVLTEEQFLSWGWRLAFLLSGVLVLFGLWIRSRLEETPVFRAMEESGQRPAAPIREVFTRQTRGLVAAVLSRMAPDVVYALFTVFVLTYATQELGYSSGAALGAVLVGSSLQVLLIPLAGALSDRVNRRLLYGIAAAGAAVWPFAFFPMVGAGGYGVLVLGIVVGLVFHSFMYGPQAAFVSEQFQPELRSTGSSLAYTLGGVIGGAIAPLLFTFLLAQFASWVPLACYILVTGAVTLAGLTLGRNPDLEQERAAAGPPAAVAGTAP
ncbi:MFS transporter [Marinitenerispora sediminis]|uniref:Putative proline/betaine transporter n=1 Tax=Marinitenerispora sediminis TaxID=1931232 RepID=A0A368T0N0_9ACTN|nr:MFS transporter [Marinitenerispora sediminis]RCV48431.1 MFS transporter [Marinitenerispora sediminis]RCV50141.1 MFS transporter [Marinitenerispora sediminis]RCV53047.1 MFS transporter [Marinitenerispora sediminis]